MCDLLKIYLNPLICIGIHLTGHGEKFLEKKLSTMQSSTDKYVASSFLQFKGSFIVSTDVMRCLNVPFRCKYFY